MDIQTMYFQLMKLNTLKSHGSMFTQIINITLVNMVG